MNAIFLPFRGIDYVFYTKHKVQTRGDNESMTAIMRSIGYDYPLAYWRGRGTLVEVGDPKVLNGKMWSDECLDEFETYQEAVDYVKELEEKNNE